LRDERALGGGVPGIVDVAEAEGLEDGDGHVEAGILDEDSSDTLDDLSMGEDGSGREVGRAVDVLHCHQLGRGGEQVEGAAVDEWKVGEISVQ